MLYGQGTISAFACPAPSVTMNSGMASGTLGHLLARLEIGLKFARYFLAAVLVWISVVSTVSAQRYDIERLRASGLQVTQSEHLTLITSVRDRADVAEFNEVFEQAVDQWCEYFSIPKATVKDWHVTGSIIPEADKPRFRELGILTDDLPPFPAGYQQGTRFWVYLQEGDYYTRHLLIHEGTHAFMEKFLGGYGAPWYAEGMAELLGVHQWEDGKLTINYDIKDRDEVPYWGRVKLVRQERDAGNRKTLDDVLAIDGFAFREVRTYGWAWAACEFFDSHPEFQDAFRKLPSVASRSANEFNHQFRQLLSDKWPEAGRQWHWMVDEIEYGYDVAQSNLVDVTERTTTANETAFKLAVDRGWQSTGIQVQAGQALQISATGRFQIKHDGESWPCTANGASIEYYRGRPVGRLIAAVGQPGQTLTLKSMDVGSDGVLEFAGSGALGTLYLRINESPAAWNDNQGQLTIKVTPRTE